ncbi:SGNH/GDSL hydrolase family protein [Roseicella aerolata]|uniref:SGNH/GDSL hydrolase family protein n=1 Tax=Roseicella aerolata TaxID=2883479 RepID=A0A9X1L9S2_9PROT|nr:SGNH/GDSL hydrolase family protein [Roseicella aerolata]MCB4821440.1 SGNH/GDSL hydrolase family protein [Roseicella aerolata]
MAATSGGMARRAVLGRGFAVMAASHAGGAGVPPGHVVLLGDSILDNKAYVGGGPDVVTQLRSRLPAGWQASLAAVNGAVTVDVARQLAGAPREATHLVVSIGGNDAARQEPVLGEPARSVGEGLARLAGVQDRFRQDYRAMLATVLAQRLPTALCTIYDPRFPDAQRRRLAIAGLTLFNDVIAREAFARGLPLIDLRLVCSEEADFANPIEPSARGGAKIAAAIAGFAAAQEAGGRRSIVHGGG